MSNGGSAVTLEPGLWWKDHPTETEVVAGEVLPKAQESSPDDPEADFMDSGGKMTEIRLDEETDLRPRDLVTLALRRSR
jgi:hypothetical protein